MKASGCGDDAMFSRQRGHDSQTIADEFREAGVRLQPAKKGSRVAGWSLMRAGSIDEPGLYLSKLCEYAWQTLPFLDRDSRHSEDLATDGPDHGADALRYGILWKPPHRITVQQISNYY